MTREKLRGDWGEALVSNYLRKRGYTIIASQFRCRRGEIDLIAQKGQTLCFVEVKTRSSGDIALPREYVDFKKQQRIRAAAGEYISRHDTDAPVRFDVAEVYVDEPLNEKTAHIEYLEAAFS